MSKISPSSRRLPVSHRRPVIGVRLIRCCSGLLRWPVIHPNHRFVLVWNVVGLCFLVALIFSLPFELSFGTSPSGLLWFFFVCMDIFFISDVFINFCTGFWDEAGECVLSPRRIRQHYLCSWFVVDMLAAIPFDIIDEATKDRYQRYRGLGTVRLLRFTRVTKATRLLRLLRSSRLQEKLDMLVEANPSLVFTLGLLQVITLLCGVTHWAACAWYLVGVSAGEDTNWVDSFVPPDADALEKYVYAVFFALTTMTTVGYGDITAKNYSEVRFVLVLLLIASVVFASLMGSLTDLISNLNAEKHAMAMKRRALSQYLSWRGVPDQLWHDVRSHFVYVWEKNKEYVAYEDEIKGQLPPVLRLELSSHIHGEALRKAPFLAFLWRYDACISELASRVYSRFLSQDDYLFKLNTPNTEVFILSDGVVRVSLNEAIFSLTHNHAGSVHAASFVDRVAAHVFSAKFAKSVEKKRAQETEEQREPGESEEKGEAEQQEVTAGAAIRRTGGAASASSTNSANWLTRRASQTLDRSSALRYLLGRKSAKSDEGSLERDMLHSPVLLNAAEKLRRQEQRETWAACYIQQRWRDSQRRLFIGEGPSTPTLSQSLNRIKNSRRSFKTRTLEAPAFFGESCLWQPFEQWDTGPIPEYTYSARCESRAEILVMERQEIQAVIRMFSPWLRDRFQFFQTSVLRGLGVKDCDGSDISVTGLVSAPSEWRDSDLEQPNDEKSLGAYHCKVLLRTAAVPSGRWSSDSSATPWNRASTDGAMPFPRRRSTGSADLGAMSAAASRLTEPLLRPYSDEW